MPSKSGGAMLSRDESNFLESLGAPRLRNCTNEAIVPAIRYLLTLIGIRNENYPVAEALVVMCDQLRTQHGSLTIKELRLAFEMAAALKLDFNPHAFQNVSVLYLNDLLNAYKRWSSATYRQLRPEGDREAELERPDFSPRIYKRLPLMALRGKIQLGYENFLSGIITNYAYIPYDWWHVLVEDGFIEHDPDAYVKENKRFGELTSDDKRRLRNSQQMVWMLFELGRNQGRKAIYERE